MLTLLLPGGDTAGGIDEGLVGQAGMLGARFACGASFLNFSCWKQDKQSATLFLLPAIRMSNTYTLILY